MSYTNCQTVSLNTTNQQRDVTQVLDVILLLHYLFYISNLPSLHIQIINIMFKIN